MIVEVKRRFPFQWPAASQLAWPALLAAGLLIGLSLTSYSPVMVAVVVLAAGAVCLIFLWPQVGTLVGVFALYSNLTVLAFRIHGAPRAFALSFLVLFGLPLIYYLFHRRRPIIVDRTFQLMLVFLFVVLVSTILSKEPPLALEWIGVFLTQGMVTYFLVVNVIRERVTFERVVTVLICTGALLGALSLYQEVTHDYTNQFLGLAQRNLAHVEDPTEFSVTPQDHVRLSHRAGGPMRESNYYAQILLVLLPFSLLRLRESRGLQWLLAWLLSLLILAGIFLSYSRGGFLALVLMAILAIRWQLWRFRTMATGVCLGVLLVALAAPGYFTRMGSLGAVASLLAPQHDREPDGAITGRATEMLAAIAVFADHPLLGVGPAHYSPHYSVEYQTDSSTAFRLLDRTRRAHSLYFEMAAELGVVGLTVFLTMVGMVLLSLSRLRRIFLTYQPDLAGLLTAATLALIGFLSTALFLQLAYQRYFWFLLALSAALERIARVELWQQSAVSADTTTTAGEGSASPIRSISPSSNREVPMLPARG